MATDPAMKQKLQREKFRMANLLQPIRIGIRESHYHAPPAPNNPLTYSPIRSSKQPSGKAYHNVSSSPIAGGDGPIDSSGSGGGKNGKGGRMKAPSSLSSSPLPAIKSPYDKPVVAKTKSTGTNSNQAKYHSTASAPRTELPAIKMLKKMTLTKPPDHKYYDNCLEQGGFMVNEKQHNGGMSSVMSMSSNHKSCSIIPSSLVTLLKSRLGIAAVGLQSLCQALSTPQPRDKGWWYEPCKYTPMELRSVCNTLVSIPFSKLMDCVIYYSSSTTSSQMHATVVFRHFIDSILGPVIKDAQAWLFEKRELNWNELTVEDVGEAMHLALVSQETIPRVVEICLEILRVLHSFRGTKTPTGAFISQSLSAFINLLSGMLQYEGTTSYSKLSALHSLEKCVGIMFVEEYPFVLDSSAKTILLWLYMTEDLPVKTVFSVTRQNAFLDSLEQAPGKGIIPECFAITYDECKKVLSERDLNKGAVIGNNTNPSSGLGFEQPPHFVSFVGPVVSPSSVFAFEDIVVPAIFAYFESGYGSTYAEGKPVEEGEGRGPRKEFFIAIGQDLMKEWSATSTAWNGGISGAEGGYTVTVTGHAEDESHIDIEVGDRLDVSVVVSDRGNNGDSLTHRYTKQFQVLQLVVKKVLGNSTYHVDKQFDEAFEDSSFTVTKPHLPLFTYCDGAKAFWINPSCPLNEDTWKRYIWCGWCLAAAAGNRCPISLKISQSLFMLLMKPQEYRPTVDDLIEFDSSYATTVSTIRRMTAKDFEVLLDNEGLDANTSKDAYIETIIDNFLEPVFAKLHAIRIGWNSIMSYHFTESVFATPSDIVDAVCGNYQDDGVSDFDFCSYFHISFDRDFLSTPQMEDAFLHCMNSMDPFHKRAFCKFVTGSDRLPAPGVETIRVELMYLPEECLFQPRVYNYILQLLPQSHTCENVIEIPNYWEALTAVEMDHVNSADLTAVLQKMLLEKFQMACTWSSGYGLDAASYHHLPRDYGLEETYGDEVEYESNTDSRQSESVHVDTTDTPDALERIDGDCYYGDEEYDINAEGIDFGSDTQYEDDFEI